MDQEQFAQMIEQAYKSALESADAIKAVAEADRQAALRELEAAQEARKNAEADGEKIAAAYFEERRAQLMEFSRQELLRQLCRKHLEAGKKPEEIAQWLDVPLDFVGAIQDVMSRAGSGKEKRTAVRGNPRLRYVNSGRGGSIYFESEETAFQMWWEFAGGDALAIIGVPDENQWEELTRLPPDRREETLRFIAEQVIGDQASGKGSFAIGRDFLTIYS